MQGVLRMHGKTARLRAAVLRAIAEYENYFGNFRDEFQPGGCRGSVRHARDATPRSVNPPYFAALTPTRDSANALPMGPRILAAPR